MDDDDDDDDDEEDDDELIDGDDDDEYNSGRIGRQRGHVDMKNTVNDSDDDF